MNDNRKTQVFDGKKFIQVELPKTIVEKINYTITRFYGKKLKEIETDEHLKQRLEEQRLNSIKQKNKKEQKD